MVNICACGGCTNSTLSGHKTHAFPKKGTPAFRSWVRFVRVKRGDFTASSVKLRHSVICGAHFKEEDYIQGDLISHRMGFRTLDRVRLVEGSVPSIQSPGQPSVSARSAAAVHKLGLSRTLQSHSATPDVTEEPMMEEEEAGPSSEPSLPPSEPQRESAHKATRYSYRRPPHRSLDQCVESRLQVKMNSPDSARVIYIKQEPEDHPHLNQSVESRLQVNISIKQEEPEDHPLNQCVESRLQVKMNSPDSARDISIKQEPEDHPHLNQSVESRLQVNISIKQEEPEDHPLNILHMVVKCKEEVSPEVSSLLQEEPDSPQIKEEQEELLQRPEETDGSMLTLLAVKGEVDDEDISSRCFEVEVKLESDTEVTEDRDDWEETSGGVRSQSSQTPFFSCSECPYAFTSQVFLHRHIRKRHYGPFCQMVRNGQITSLASEQILSSYGDQQFANRLHCEHCNKSFSGSASFKAHQRIHTGEKPFQCKHCDKSFMWSGAFMEHQRVHTGEKPFKKSHCKHCDKSFRWPSDLKTHQRVHTGEKPFHCKQCDKSFSWSCSLKSHQFIHT